MLVAVKFVESCMLKAQNQSNWLLRNKLGKYPMRWTTVKLTYSRFGASMILIRPLELQGLQKNRLFTFLLGVLHAAKLTANGCPLSCQRHCLKRHSLRVANIHIHDARLDECLNHYSILVNWCYFEKIYVKLETAWQNKEKRLECFMLQPRGAVTSAFSVTSDMLEVTL